MTLKPSKKTQKQNKTNKKTKKEKKRKKKQENTENTQKWAFQLSVKIFFFLGGFSKFPSFDILAQKAWTQKHYKK